VGEYLGTDRKRSFIDIEMGGMQRAATLIPRRHTQPEQAAGNVLQVS
jgi:hypothetical protein